MLTNAGLAFATRVCRVQSQEDPVNEAEVKRERVPAEPPRWDPATRTLWLGSVLIKQLKVPALNQERILSAFAEEGWPPCIDDPLPPSTGINSKRRLRDTITRLNRSQNHRLIRFHGNGNGLAIHWERHPTHVKTDSRATAKRL